MSRLLTFRVGGNDERERTYALPQFHWNGSLGVLKYHERRMFECGTDDA